MTWEPELEEIRRRTELAKQMGGTERVQRQHDQGRLTVRERLERLLDKGSFHEIGALAGFPTYEGDELTDFSPSNIISGTGRIDGRRVVVCGDDFSVRGGAADAAIHLKQIHAERMANELRLPIVRLIEGSGGGGSVKSYESFKRTYIPANPGLGRRRRQPRQGAVRRGVPRPGRRTRRGARRHRALLRDGEGERAAVRRRAPGREGRHEPGRHEGRARRLGDPRAAVRRGRQRGRGRGRRTRAVPALPHVPARRACGRSRRATTSDDDPERRDEELISIVPRERRKVYDARKILRLVFDEGSVFEIGRYYGRRRSARSRRSTAIPSP